MHKFVLVFASAIVIAGCHGPEADNKTVTDGAGNTLTTKKDGMDFKNAKGDTASVGTATVSEADLGVAFYPGSTATEAKDTKFTVDGKTTVMSIRTTTDEPAKVVEFYKDKVTGPEQVSTDKMAMITGTLSDKRKIVIMAEKKDALVEIDVNVTQP